MAPSLAASLASLTGLDQETASTQLLPHLDSLPSQAEVRAYLDSLLAPGPAAQSFTQSYIAQRFPSSSASSSSSAQPARRWGASPAASATNSRSASPLPPPAQPSKADQVHKLEKAFAGAGGRVYVKEKEGDVGGWGSGAAGSKKGSAATSRASSATRTAPPPPVAAALAPPVPVVGPSPTPPSSSSRASPAPPATAAAAGKGAKGKGKQEDAGLELSEEAVRELGGIERALKGFQANGGRPKGREKRCFCQARQHPLSPYTPLCPLCALVLCALNAPSLPCPSCAHTPLLSSASTASHIATLQTQREALLAREKARVRREREQAERERAAVRFPELGADYGGVDRRGLGGGGGYAAHAGGGMSLSDRIDRAYEKGTTLSGRPLQQQAAPAQGKVLRLGANGKVKVQTKRLVPTSKGKSRLQEQTVGTIDPGASSDEDDAAAGPFVDEDDDGLRGEVALLSVRAEREGWAADVEQRTGAGAFVRVTLREGDRPVYVPASAAEGASAFYGGGDDADADAGEASPAAPSLVQEKLHSRPTVPGAAPPPAAAAAAGKGGQEEGKGKRRRGRGKGEKGKEAGAEVQEKKEEQEEAEQAPGGWAE
ncbi:hypothetical protein JCM6882_007434 [Rhodosporidiobolus microsporus]